MKLVLTALCLSALSLNAASLKDTSRRYNASMGIEVFQPLLSPADMQYNGDQWQLNSANDFLNRYNPVAYGINVQVKSGNFMWGARAGMAHFNLDESSGFNAQVSNVWSYRDVKNHYKQDLFQICLNAKAVHHIGRFGLGIGAELPVVFFQSGERSQHTEVRQNFPNSDAVYAKSVTSTTYHMPSGSTSGIGALLEVSYMLSDRLSFSVAIRDYLLYMRYVKSWDMSYSNQSFTYNQDGTLASPSSYTTNYILKSDSKNIGFSRISTVLSLSYHFHAKSRLRLKGM